MRQRRKKERQRNIQIDTLMKNEIVENSRLIDITVIKLRYNETEKKDNPIQRYKQKEQQNKLFCRSKKTVGPAWETKLQAEEMERERQRDINLRYSETEKKDNLISRSKKTVGPAWETKLPPEEIERERYKTEIQ